VAPAANWVRTNHPVSERPKIYETESESPVRYAQASIRKVDQLYFIGEGKFFYWKVVVIWPLYVIYYLKLIGDLI
jgi:hypothetical protein